MVCIWYANKSKYNHGLLLKGFAPGDALSSHPTLLHLCRRLPLLLFYKTYTRYAPVGGRGGVKVLIHITLTASVKEQHPQGKSLPSLLYSFIIGQLVFAATRRVRDTETAVVFLSVLRAAAEKDPNAAIDSFIVGEH